MYLTKQISLRGLVLLVHDSVFIPIDTICMIVSLGMQLCNSSNYVTTNPLSILIFLFFWLILSRSSVYRLISSFQAVISNYFSSNQLAVTLKWLQAGESNCLLFKYYYMVGRTFKTSPHISWPLLKTAEQDLPTAVNRSHKVSHLDHRLETAICQSSETWLWAAAPTHWADTMPQNQFISHQLLINNPSISSLRSCKSRMSSQQLACCYRAIYWYAHK